MSDKESGENKIFECKKSRVTSLLHLTKVEKKPPYKELLFLHGN